MQQKEKDKVPYEEQERTLYKQNYSSGQACNPERNNGPKIARKSPDGWASQSLKGLYCFGTSWCNWKPA